MVADRACSRPGSAPSTRKRWRRSAGCGPRPRQLLVRHRHARAATSTAARSTARACRSPSASGGAVQHRASASRSASSPASCGWLDAIVMRVMDGLMSIPSVLLAIALMALTKASLGNVIFAITMAEVPRVARLVRGVVLTPARAALRRGGARGRHRLPAHAAAPHPAQHAGAAAGAGDLYLRLGDDYRGDPELHRRRHAAARSRAGATSWPTARSLFQIAPYLILFPGVFLSLTVLAVNLVGDGLRDALDPRLARRM